MHERKTTMVIIGCVVGIALGGYALGRQHVPDPILDTEVRHHGLFGHETSRIIATAVTNLRAEGKLVVYSYTGSAQVLTERTKAFGLVRGRQFLSVPGAVSYHLDLSDIGMDDMRLDEQTRTLFVTLPPLHLGDIAMAPDQQHADNRGLLTISDRTVQELQLANYRKARRAFIAQAQQPEIVGLARREAERLVARQMEVPLHAAGLSDIGVVVRFRDRSNKVAKV